MDETIDTWLTRFAAGAGSQFVWYLDKGCIRARVPSVRFPDAHFSVLMASFIYEYGADAERYLRVEYDSDGTPVPNYEYMTYARSCGMLGNTCYDIVVAECLSDTIDAEKEQKYQKYRDLRAIRARLLRICRLS